MVLGGIKIRNLSTVAISTEEEGINQLFIGDTNRAIAETPMNQASTRSHCIFTIHLEIMTPGEPLVKRSKAWVKLFEGQMAKSWQTDNILPSSTYFFKNMINNSEISYTWSIWPDQKELEKLVSRDKLPQRENISIYHFTISNR